MRRSSACWRRTSPACRRWSGSPTTSHELADIIVQTTLDLCWQKLKERHPHPSSRREVAVIAYGKLGGKELGYGSDLDLVFLHNDPEPDVGELYARLGQRMSTWMSSQTSAGMLFEVDLRLRPNGDVGNARLPGRRLP
jgi:glutamate-ammonia-ligase adenylyltransferase